MAVAEFPFCYSAVGNLEESAKLPAVHPGRFAQFEDFLSLQSIKLPLIYVKTRYAIIFNIKIKITQRVNLFMQLYCWPRKAETPFAPVQLSHIF